MSQITQSAVHCINPDCKRPYPQPWGNKFCNSCGAPLQLLDRYYPIQPLGSGGFAQIYTIWDDKTRTEKVLKVLVEESPKALELFTQEAAVLINLRHPGVPKVDADGYFQINLAHPKPHQLACLVMEKINGLTLEEILKNHPQGCAEGLVLTWLVQAVKILQELHRRQIIHRDIKPSNLMLRNPSSSVQGDQLVLIDFGGAKQFSGSVLRTPSSSTRLFSSGYSPPEQFTGGNVGPAADFYALGRTMIELLTGKYPPELEDPQTGKLCWRNRGNFHPELADLLDEMVQEDVRSRPASAGVIQKRLLKISQSSQQGPVIFQYFDGLIKALDQAIINFNLAIGKSALFILRLIGNTLLACLATLWAMILTGISAGLGAIAGFFLAYSTNLGEQVAEFLSLQLPELLPSNQHTLGAEIVVFAFAGLGTAWGLTLSGCFGQQRRYLVTAFMGIISYSLAWIVWQLITPQDSREGSVGWTLVAVSLLTLSFNFRSHYMVYAFIATFGSAIVLAGLIHIGIAPSVFHFIGHSSWLELLLPITFFSFIGILTSFWLGLSYYLIVPGLRWLGWRS